MLALRARVDELRTGAGDKAFIAGADISELARLTAVEAEAYSRQGQGLLDLIENFGKPVVAAVNGYALTSLPEGLALEGSLFAICAATQDKAEGTSAFLAKRAASFQGH